MITVSIYKQRRGLFTPSIYRGGSMVSALRLGVVVTAVLIASGASAQSRSTYKDPAAPVEQRVQDLLSRMTLEEKIAQITAVWARKNELLDAKGNFNPEAAQRLYPA